ncbi:UDP-N-acetylglucosamine diphosphorylase [Pelagicoccus sp. NFK12]|uniref:UDP-N-acetylglucosamine diphosphorylase n=1 Tax=Pelagicoccus enzymogenes TaxID=2773457 RepID=A0A927IHH3_9BACT|nr:UDP-N-acetylglucosamine diphosphorylase [Pelagicoccus enzymogenes]MBD5779713.1 UDP-N-acetylglucosamine diphosphorylase [Pelagicoccus enzymogenes]
MKASDLFSFPDSIPFADFFAPNALPWEWIQQIKPALASGFEERLPEKIPAGVSIKGKVFIHESVELPPFCSIEGPVWIGEGVQIRPGAYIRGNVIIGAGSVVGNSCEYKNCLLLEGVQTPHFSYIGDSVLGNRSHLGAGVILSNLRLDQKPVKVRTGDGLVDTGMRKFGALLGDDAEVGCNAVLNPGSILGRKAIVGPLIPFVGTLGEGRMLLGKPASRQVDRPE